MYGIPNQNEIDPTIFVAITAFIMFGFMFGDIGHGLVFLILGIILRRKNKDFRGYFVDTEESPQLYLDIFMVVFSEKKT